MADIEVEDIHEFVVQNFVTHNSGKDPTKVDRSGAYMARYVAKHIVAAGYASKAQVQVSYSIGVANPTSLRVNTFGTGTVSDSILEEGVRKVFDFRPLAIIEELDLRKPQYEELSKYGHMGRIDITPMPAWEQMKRLDEFERVITCLRGLKTTD
jgi:S-adenosylmethionine synthetase